MLFLKMLRDIKENKGSYIACIVVVMTGLFIFTSMNMVSRNLNLATDKFYETTNFADGFMQVRNFPLSMVDELSDINGIKQVEGRIVKDVRVVTNDDRNAYLRLITVNMEDTVKLNAPLLIEGNYIDDNSNNILVDTKYFEANGLKLGDKIEVIIDGKKVEFSVNGTEMSPDFVYAMRNANDLFPNPEVFGIAYVPYSIMQNYLQDKNQVNDISFTIQEGVPYKEVEKNIKDYLDNDTIVSIVARKDQPSHMLITQELTGLEKTCKTMPLMFLGIAGFILYIMLKRLIEQQRGQIGLIKSFGYEDREILYHYMSYALVVGVIGGVLGGLIGMLIAGPMTNMYKEFFNIPGLKNIFSYDYFIIGIILSVITSLIAGFQGSKNVLKLQPAESMRPPSPKNAKNTALEKIKLFWNSLNIQGKMAIRNIFRNKGRSIFTLVGVMFAFSIICASYNAFNWFDLMFYDQYEKVQVYDCKMSFNSFMYTDEVVQDVQNKKGINIVEPMLEVPAKVTNKWLNKDVPILGLGSESQLYNVLDKDENKIVIPQSGIVLSQRVAELLEAKVGTVVELDLPFIEQKHKVNVVKIIPQYLGINAYMNIDSLSEILGSQRLATSVIMKVDKEQLGSIKEHYSKSPNITGIEIQNDLIKKLMEMMQMGKSMIWSLLVFAIVIGFIIVYTSSVISFSERQRELASLRVLGFYEKEVLEVISIEQVMISIVAIILGIPVTKGMMEMFSVAFSNDLYTMPVNVKVESIIVGILGTVIALFIARLSIKKKIRKLQLVEVLKDKE